MMTTSPMLLQILKLKVETTGVQNFSLQLIPVTCYVEEKFAPPPSAQE